MVSCFNSIQTACFMFHPDMKLQEKLNGHSLTHVDYFRGQSLSAAPPPGMSQFDKPSLFFLLSDTASSTLYFLAPPLQIHTEEEGCNQHVGKVQELIGHIHCTHTSCSDHSHTSFSSQEVNLTHSLPTER
ncbi:hypothetical protein NQZ68_042131 [Dissostichus eleginoides]|nr:hypothetical protein NQZ68_042131 [Dissostichus eleginoides]